ncbi:MAG: cupredoxin family copper-binding protein [Candidatus Velthaea sp.]
MNQLLFATLLALAPAGGAHVVHIADFAFAPAAVTVAVGDEVTFVNDDTEPHTATSTAFDSGGLDLHQSWTHRFTRPGTFAYHCTLHPGMTGRIVVRAARPKA